MNKRHKTNRFHYLKLEKRKKNEKDFQSDTNSFSYRKAEKTVSFFFFYFPPFFLSKSNKREEDGEIG